MDWNGLAALSWDPSGGAVPGADFAFLRRLLDAQATRGVQGAALDVGCGTGRLLLPLLAAGYEIEGVDSAGDMLAICRAKAGALKLDPVLYHQRMEVMATNRRYAAAFISCGTLMLLTEAGQNEAALLRLREHLMPGGALSLSLASPHGPESPLRASSRTGPEVAWQRWHQATLADGLEIVQELRVTAVDPVGQRRDAERRYRAYRSGVLIKEEAFAMRLRYYTVSEFTLLLRLTGFSGVVCTGDWSDIPFDPACHTTMTVTAVAS